jgi:hypothetical protein
MRWKAVARSSLLPGVALLALSGTARAQSPPSGGDKVAAEALFEDARRFVADGKYAEACPKFADSERLDPSPSTLLNLANCWEKVGRSATAWATYREAESAAQAAKRPDYKSAAQRHADALAPKLARLTIHVQQAVAGMQLKRDGVIVGAAEWETAIPIDKGTHSIEASAPGYKNWATRVDVSQDGTQMTTSIPPFEEVPAEPPGAFPLSSSSTASPPAPPRPPVPPETPQPKASSQGAVGLVVAAVGIAGLGASGVLAWLANTKKNDSLGHCATPNSCSPLGVSERNDALALGDAATVVFAIGATALATGVVVWLGAPSPATRRSARVVVAPRIGGAVVEGTW